MVKRIGIILWVGFSLAAKSAFGQVKKPWYKKLNPDSLFSSNLKVIAVPTIQNAPETSWNFGAGVTYYFNTDKLPDSLATTRTSTLVATGGYSLRRQLQFEGRWQIFTNKERMLYRGTVAYSNFFDRFWGIGNNAPTEDLSEFSFTRIQVQANALNRVRSNIFLGLNYQFSVFQDLDWFLQSSNLDLARLNGGSGNRVSGLGPTVVVDFRDNPYSAVSGYFAEFSALYYRNGLGSSHHFDEYLIDLRYYIPLPRKHVLAFQTFGNFMNGNVPFRELPRLGGPQIMRGYFNGRFLDRNLLATQAEYRMPIWKFVACSFFMSVGQVAPYLSEFKMANFKAAYGAGLRLRLNAKENIYVRFDYARTADNQSGFYIRVNDAF